MAAIEASCILTPKTDRAWELMQADGRAATITLTPDAVTMNRDQQFSIIVRELRRRSNAR